MSIFNFFKRKKQASREQLLEESRSGHDISADNETVSYQGLLSGHHSRDDSTDSIHEVVASENKHINDDTVEVTSEMRVSDPSYKGYLMRKNDGKEYSMPDMALASEKSDRRFRDAYIEAESKLKDKKNLFTSMSGMQLDRDPQMVADNIPLEHGGINTAPERFKDFGEVPGHCAKMNLKNLGKEPEVSPMKFASNNTSEHILSMIKDADALCFMIKYQQSSSNSDLDKYEIDNLSKIKAAKSFLVESLRTKIAQEEIDMTHEQLDRLVAQEQAEIEGQKEEEISNLLQDESEEEIDTADDKIEEIDQRLRTILGE